MYWWPWIIIIDEFLLKECQVKVLMLLCKHFEKLYELMDGPCLRKSAWILGTNMHY